VSMGIGGGGELDWMGEIRIVGGDGLRSSPTSPQFEITWSLTITDRKQQ
jgi:hypothetical protein